jgi:hypothetical protein
MVKRQWAKPELTVLVRSTAEETVLTACKGTVQSQNAPSTRTGRASTNCAYRGINCSTILPS